MGYKRECSEAKLCRLERVAFSFLGLLDQDQVRRLVERVDMRGGWTHKRVLILVKTYPNPSEKHREIVCTAGLDMETRTLIRLFPIPFRMLDNDSKFQKWQFVELDVRKASDSRIESYEVLEDSIETGETIGTEGNGWERRWAYIEHLISPSLEAVAALPPERRPSLAIIKPRDCTMTIVPHKHSTYNKKERRKLMGVVAHDTLFGDYSKYVTLLEKIPLKFRYHFRIGVNPDSEMYTAFFEDWEVGEAWRKWRELYPDPLVLNEKIINRFLDVPNAKDNLYLAIGTHSQYRHQWLAIGQFQPILGQRSTTSQLSLPLT
ncbi:MAG: hypothetical protein ACYDGW_10745 [Vulcanimicrobiaceae bacterium]